MAYQYDDEDDFDDGFDGLPDNALHLLERNALTLSQHDKVAPARRPQATTHRRSRRDVRDADGWQMMDVDQAMPAPPSSDYGFDDEDVIDMDDPTMVIENVHASMPRTRAQQPHDTVRPGNTSPKPCVIDEAGNDYQKSELDWSRLQAKVSQLENEQLALQKMLDEAKSDAMAKAGAISILRSKHDKSTKEYERKLSVMQKLHFEESTKQRADIEAARKDQETIKTNNKFLEHDLAQEVERSKRLKGASNAANQPSKPDVTMTPRKSQTLPFRDGFDDHEILAISPSRSKERDKSQRGTPKAGGKRKRAVEASPSIPLNIADPPNNHEISIPVAVQDDETMRMFSKELQSREESITTLQRVLSHVAVQGHPRTVEALGRYSFPDAPGITLSGLLLQDLSSSRLGVDHPVSVQVCFSCMDLWSRCLSLSYFEPLSLILNLFEFILISESSKIRGILIRRFIPLAIKSIDLLALPRVMSMQGLGHSAPVHEAQNQGPHESIDDNLIVSMLHTLASSASAHSELVRSFWQEMEFDFVLLMLNKAQPLPQITLVLQTLTASVLEDCFGAENADSERQARNEASTLDRMTSLLFERPIAPAGERPYSPLELVQLRIDILQTLAAICNTEHGSSTLAEHRSVIGRLVRFLSIQVTSLDCITPSSILSSKPENGLQARPSVHKLTIASINLTTRLIYYLLHTHGKEINLPEKLAVIHGGHQKFLVAFTRLAFSEQLVMEVGLDEEVADAAHEILDVVLSPEEGEAIVQAVETPRGTTSNRVSVQPMGSGSGR